MIERFGAAGFCRDVTEADDAERAGAEDFEAAAAPQEGFAVVREPAAMLHQGAKPAHAQHLHRQPNLQSAEAARQGDAVVGEVDLILARLDVLHVLRPQRKGARQKPAVAEQHAARLERLREPLVRIESD